MMRGLLAKTLRETWLSTLLFAVGLMLVERLLIFILPQMQQQASGILASLPFARSMLSALLSIEIGDQLTAQMLQSIVWIDPVVLALVWAHEISFCTRFPAGEIDRGTIDVLLGLPVSRRRAYVGESIVWLASGAVIVTIGSLGYFLGAGSISAADRPSIAAVMLVQTNLLCMYVAIGGVAYAVSALNDRRGRAIAIVFALVLASFLLNFLAQFWPPAKNFAFLGVLNYYKPAQILTTGALPVRDVVILLVVGAAAWIAGGEIIARRSIATV